MVKLIVNGDDFGITNGVNRGILEVSRKGILTSTSVMVNRPYADEIKSFHKMVPNIGIGIHIEFAEELLQRYKGGEYIDKVEIIDSIEEQISKFKRLSGFIPDHMDFHKVAIRQTKTFVIDDISVFKTPVEIVSKKYRLPWRGMPDVVVLDSFHGAIYDPITHKKSRMDLERISPKSLIQILKSLKKGNYELMTHPGFIDKNLTSSYALEREKEIFALCNSDVVNEITKHKIQLVKYSQIFK